MARIVIDRFLGDLFECDALELFGSLRSACKVFRDRLPEYSIELARILCTCRHLRDIESSTFHARAKLCRRVLEIRILFRWIEDPLAVFGCSPCARL